MKVVYLGAETKILLFMEILSKDNIKRYIIPHLQVGSFGKSLEPEFMVEIVSAILYRLKTGVQWRFLPVKSFFSSKSLTWQGVYYHFREWIKDGSWTQVWINLLLEHRRDLDLSCVQLDGSHTPCKRGGAAVGYQGRKASKTSNTLYLCDNQGQMLCCASPQEGQHNDLFELQTLFDEICNFLTKAGIDVKGLFLNADAGFDSKEFRKACEQKEVIANIPHNPRNKKEIESRAYQYFDEELYKQRYVIERANAWQDQFKALIIRYETRVDTWVNLLILSFMVIFIRRIIKKK
ncbi:MAG: DDE transposase [Bacteroidia bacterium]|nr:MAG: DDE transposase [Bacteroidia bacterium]